ncbi:cytochrome C oxidase subunit IV family protein [Longimicrobium terrae]|uniref:Caa(3)-type oxidase subunit IV n=1 Tax=Longimicrobium terrae TaxID=1639882 RepID=A0A841H682_9BACT|nr:cytochrome C oxidase subunit IV family protein [Longimicrobium terrae]MBB4638180.1 caa(3)-type oxidase subunit IV [Longimicrobium terrae]MBB6073661.1 caa(3)-type oxidase subunit IV [Longimicrobium terrae]NNC30339.1 cytochrome C oxidase subunit IV family protein [Longimicrobium terrae]
MSSETHEMAHGAHAHPTNRFYLIIGLILLVLTGLEVLGYMGETSGALSSGMSAIIILVLSAAKFILVVAYYMHLKFDHKLFTGVFLFPAALAILVIGSMIMLFHILHGTATRYPGHGTLTNNESVHGPATAPRENPGAPTTPSTGEASPTPH